MRVVAVWIVSCAWAWTWAARCLAALAMVLISQIRNFSLFEHAACDKPLLSGFMRPGNSQSAPAVEAPGWEDAGLLDANYRDCLALELGVLNRLAPPGNALAEALALAHKLNQRAPNALASIKELLNDAATNALHQQLASERDHFVRNLHHANAGTGIAALLDATR